MATHSSILPLKMTWTEEPGGLQSIGSQRVGHDRATEYARVHIAHTHTPSKSRKIVSSGLPLLHCDVVCFLIYFISLKTK